MYDPRLSFILDDHVIWVENKQIYLVYNSNKHLIGREGDKILELRNAIKEFIS